MLWIINFFINLANILALWIPLLCYLVMAVCGLYVALKLYGFGARGRGTELGFSAPLFWRSFAAALSPTRTRSTHDDFPATVHANG